MFKQIPQTFLGTSLLVNRGCPLHTQLSAVSHSGHQKSIPSLFPACSKNRQGPSRTVATVSEWQKLL